MVCQKLVSLVYFKKKYFAGNNLGNIFYYLFKFIITPIMELITVAIRNIIERIKPAFALPLPLLDFNPFELDTIPYIVTG